MLNLGPPPPLTRRRFTQLPGMAVGSLALSGAARAASASDATLEIAPYTLEASPKHHIRTVAYNGQIRGPLFRMREGEPQSVEVRNLTKDPEVVHWHGLYLPPDIDGAMEEGTPMIAPGCLRATPWPPGPQASADITRIRSRGRTSPRRSTVRAGGLPLV
jgi:FtsP/CotA-like multicopper oxidase with cupredoxin domain